MTLVDFAKRGLVFAGFGTLMFLLGAGWQERQTLAEVAQSTQKQLVAYKQFVDREVRDSREKNEKLVSDLRETANKQDAIKQAALDRLQRQLSAAKGKSDVREYDGLRGPAMDVAVACPGPDFRLDVGTVRLLDAARANLPAPDPASGTDEALDAASAVGVTDLVANDLDIVKLYHELAKRHDGLVDYIESKQKQNQ